MLDKMITIIIYSNLYAFLNLKHIMCLNCGMYDIGERYSVNVSVYITVRYFCWIITCPQLNADCVDLAWSHYVPGRESRNTVGFICLITMVWELALCIRH